MIDEPFLNLLDNVSKGSDFSLVGKEVPKYTFEQARDFSPDELLAMGTAERMGVLRALRPLLLRRVHSIEKADVYSFALERAKEKLKKRDGTQIGLTDKILEWDIKTRSYRLSPKFYDVKNVNNILLRQIRAAQYFLDPIRATSTLSGIKKVNDENDMRLFGYKEVTRYRKSGKERAKVPKKRLTPEQRKIFWDVHNELRKSTMSSVTDYYSLLNDKTGYIEMWANGDFDNMSFDDILRIAMDLTGGNALEKKQLEKVHEEVATGDLGDSKNPLSRNAGVGVLKNKTPW